MTARVRGAKNAGDRVLREKRLVFFVMYKKMMEGVGAYRSATSLCRFFAPAPLARQSRTASTQFRSGGNAPLVDTQHTILNILLKSYS